MDERHRIGGSTHLAGVIGWPIDHSLSPVIHNAAYEALGLDWVYVALPVAQGAVGAALEGLEALGFAGANVTMPHKETVAATLEALSDDAALLRRRGSSGTPRTPRGSDASSSATPGSMRRARARSCSAQGAPLERARWRSPGRALPESWSLCGNQCAHPR